MGSSRYYDATPWHNLSTSSTTTAFTIRIPRREQLRHLLAQEERAVFHLLLQLSVFGILPSSYDFLVSHRCLIDGSFLSQKVGSQGLVEGAEAVLVKA